MLSKSFQRRQSMVDKCVTRWRILIQLASSVWSNRPTFGIIFNSVQYRILALLCMNSKRIAKRIWFIRVHLSFVRIHVRSHAPRINSSNSICNFEWSLDLIERSNLGIGRTYFGCAERYTIFSIVFRPFVLPCEYLEENVAPFN